MGTSGGAVVVDELNDGLAHLNDLALTWGFYLDTFLPERAQQAPTASEAGDGTAETMDWIRLDGVRLTAPRPL